MLMLTIMISKQTGERERKTFKYDFNRARRKAGEKSADRGEETTNNKTTL
jgi:hypothetical protein